MSHVGYEISTDDQRLDRSLIHRFLHDDSYWARGIPREVMDRAIDNSLCFGLYDEAGSQVGFGRAVTDRAAIAYEKFGFRPLAEPGRMMELTAPYQMA